jgi:thymidylate synthase
VEIIQESFADIYQSVRSEMLRAPEVSPKGIKTKELRNVTIVLTKPWKRLGFHPMRKFSLPFAVAETAMLFNPTDMVQYISYINRRMMQFSDDGKTLHGSYGRRIAVNISLIQQILEMDPYSRQAVLSVYSNVSDLGFKSKDIPCTLSLQFLLRDVHEEMKELELYVTMRSNDLFWGLPYDLFMFTTLQEVMANSLNKAGHVGTVKLGNYYHRATSLHVYERHYTMLDAIESMGEDGFDVNYTIEDMEDLSEKVILMSDQVPDKSGDVFTEILRYHELRKRNFHHQANTELIQEWPRRYLESMNYGRNNGSSV